MKTVIIISLCIGFSQLTTILTPLCGQTQLLGKVTDQDTGEPILIGTVAIFKKGVLVTGTDTDFDGNYFFQDLDAGIYDIEVSYVGYGRTRITDVPVKDKMTVVVNIQIKEQRNCSPLIISCCGPPMIEFDNMTRGRVFSSRDLQNLPIK